MRMSLLVALCLAISPMLTSCFGIRDKVETSQEIYGVAKRLMSGSRGKYHLDYVSEGEILIYNGAKFLGRGEDARQVYDLLRHHDIHSLGDFSLSLGAEITKEVAFELIESLVHAGMHIRAG